MATSKKPSAAQVAARELFAKRAKAGEFARKRRKTPAKKRASNPIASGVIGEWHTRTGKIGLRLVQHGSGSYSYTGEWGSGSGSNYADIYRRVMMSVKAHRGAKTIVEPPSPNPRTRRQDIAIAMSEQRAGHPRKAKEFFERAARAKNPHRGSVSTPSRFEVHRTDARGDSLRHVATFGNKAEAMAYARALANAKGWTVGIKGRR